MGYQQVHKYNYGGDHKYSVRSLDNGKLVRWLAYVTYESNSVLFAS